MLVVYTGCMSSGKSTELVNQYTRHTIAHKHCLFIAHESDKERGGEIHFTHGHTRTDHISPVYTPRLTLLNRVIDIYDCVFIDEGQWFPDLVETCLEWCKEKCVFVACLDSDYLQRPLVNVAQLCVYADRVIHHRAVCTKCGSENASCTIRTSGSDSIVEVGDSDSYKAVCRNCILTVPKNEIIVVDESGVRNVGW